MMSQILTGDKLTKVPSSVSRHLCFQL